MSNCSTILGVSLPEGFRTCDTQKEMRRPSQGVGGKITEFKLNSRREDKASSYQRGTGNQIMHLNNKSNTI